MQIPWLLQVFPDHFQIPWLFQVFQILGKPGFHVALVLYKGSKSTNTNNISPWTQKHTDR